MGKKTRFQSVDMDAVPAKTYNRKPGLCQRLYRELEAIPRVDGKALEVRDRIQRLYYIRHQLRVWAQRDGRQLGSQRNDAGTVFWFWFEEKSGEGKSG